MSKARWHFPLPLQAGHIFCPVLAPVGGVVGNAGDGVGDIGGEEPAVTVNISDIPSIVAA